MKTILTIFQTENLIPILLFCVTLGVITYSAILILKSRREKKLVQNIAEIKKLYQEEETFHNKVITERWYQYSRKDEIRSKITEFLEETEFDFQADPLQTMKDVITYHRLVIGAELASCDEINGKLYDIIKCVIALIDNTPYKLPGDDTDKLALSEAIKRVRQMGTTPSE